MIDEKKLSNATMSDEELDQVAGGGYSKEEAEKVVTDAFGEKLKELAPSIQKLLELFTEEKSNTNKV